MIDWNIDVKTILDFLGCIMQMDKSSDIICHMSKMKIDLHALKFIARVAYNLRREFGLIVAPGQMWTSAAHVIP